MVINTFIRKRSELAELLGVDIKTLSNWGKNKPELVRLINLGLKADMQIKATKELLETLEEIEVKSNSGKFELK